MLHIKVGGNSRFFSFARSTYGSYDINDWMDDGYHLDKTLSCPLEKLPGNVLVIEILLDNVIIFEVTLTIISRKRDIENFCNHGSTISIPTTKGSILEIYSIHNSPDTTCLKMSSSGLNDKVQMNVFVPRLHFIKQLKKLL